MKNKCFLLVVCCMVVFVVNCLYAGIIFFGGHYKGVLCWFLWKTGKMHLVMYNEQRKNLNLDYFGDFVTLCVICANMCKCRWGWGG